MFVEAGAHDGYTQSNTYWLERHRGWSGVLIEAVPSLAAKCARRRRAQVFQCALVGAADPGATVTIRFGDLMSTVEAGQGSAVEALRHAEGGLEVTGQRTYAVEVPARTLTSVLDEAGLGSPDLVTLDIEGHELEVLRGLDLDRHAPRFLLLEMLEMDKQLPVFEDVLDGRYEIAEVLSHCDVLFRRL